MAAVGESTSFFFECLNFLLFLPRGTLLLRPIILLQSAQQQKLCCLYLLGTRPANLLLKRRLATAARIDYINNYGKKKKALPSSPHPTLLCSHKSTIAGREAPPIRVIFVCSMSTHAAIIEVRLCFCLVRVVTQKLDFGGGQSDSPTNNPMA